MAEQSIHTTDVKMLNQCCYDSHFAASMKNGVQPIMNGTEFVTPGRLVCNEPL